MTYFTQAVAHGVSRDPNAFLVYLQQREEFVLSGARTVSEYEDSTMQYFSDAELSTMFKPG